MSVNERLPFVERDFGIQRSSLNHFLAEVFEERIIKMIVKLMNIFTKAVDVYDKIPHHKLRNKRANLWGFGGLSPSLSCFLGILQKKVRCNL